MGPNRNNGINALEGVRTGTVQIRKGDKVMYLEPASIVTVEVEVEAKNKKDKQKSSIEISWEKRQSDSESLGITPVDAQATEPQELPESDEERSPLVDDETAE